MLSDSAYTLRQLRKNPGFTADTGATVQAARAIVQRLEPELPARFRTFQQVFAASLGTIGAETSDVSRMILGQGMKTISIGVAIGIAGSLALTRTLQSMLFGVTPTDPLTFVGVTGLLVGAALLACWIPARRATKVDPMLALRAD